MTPPPTAPVPVLVSARSARLIFHGCEPGYIATTCHARCCDSSTAATGIIVSILPKERPRIEALGGRVEAGLLQPRPGERRCPFKTGAHLCGLHGTPDKPLGCVASPFTVSAGNTLIVRNRYKLLKCYRDGTLPAYVAFRGSLDTILGRAEAGRVCAHLDAGGGDLRAWMPADMYAALKENDRSKHPERARQAVLGL